MLRRMCHILIDRVMIMLFLLVAAPDNWAQEAAKPAAHQPLRRFETFALTTGNMYTLLQDQDGFFWIGSWTGLHQWNGRTIRTYTPSNSALLDANVMVIYKDMKGMLWFGSLGGLNSYDKVTETWTAYKNDPNDPASLSDNQAGYLVNHHSIAEDREGMLWVGTAGGLNRLDPVTGRFTRYLHIPENPASLINDQVQAVLVARDGALWVGTAGGLCRFDTPVNKFTCYTHDPANPQSLSDNTVNVIYQDRVDLLWIGTQDGLNRFDPTSETFTVWRYDEANPTGLPSKDVTEIVEDDAGYLWLSHVYSLNGISVFDPRTQTFIHYMPGPTPGSLGGDYGNSDFWKDQQGAIWITSMSGVLSKYDVVLQSPFITYRHIEGDSTSLKGPSAVGFVEDRQGRIWVPTTAEADGLMTFDRETDAFTAQPAPHISKVHLEMGILASDGTYWVNDVNGMVYQLDIGTLQVLGSYKASRGMIASIQEDPQDSNLLWIVSASGDGLVKLDRATGTIMKYIPIQGDPASITSLLGYAPVLFDPHDPDIIWFPGYGGGLDRFNKRTGKVEQNYRKKEVNPKSIGANIVGPLLYTTDGEYWLATNGGGLQQFDPKTGEFVTYSKKNGLLPTDSILAMLEDDQGNLWLHSSDPQGLVRFTPTTGAWKFFGKESGVECGQPFPFGHFKESTGALWFSGTNGAVRFDPEQVKENTYKPPVYITSLTQSGESMKLPAASELIKTITIPWDKPFFEFEAAALSFTSPQNNLYKYILEGVDKDWIDPGRIAGVTVNIGRYSGLRGGTYTLKVMGSNNDGVWSDQVAELKVIVTSPFYKTTWFYTLCGVFGFGILGVIYRFQIQANTQKLKAEKETALHEAAERERDAAEASNRAKSTFLSNMSHELRTPLNGILGYAQILSRDRSLSGMQKEGLNIIYDSGNHLLTLINDILDLAKVEAGKLELAPTNVHLRSFLDSVAGVIGMRAEQRNLLFELEAAPDLPAGIHADEVRLRQVLLNLLGNSVKFTKEGKVTLKVTNVIASEAKQSRYPGEMASSKTPRHDIASPDEIASQSLAMTGFSSEGKMATLRFEIMDTGVGISPEDLGKLFKPFEQVGDMQTRAEGTGLGLAITRRIVHMMGGEMRVESTVGKGSRFWFDVTVPVADVAAAPGQPHLLHRQVIGYDGPRRTIVVADDKHYNRLVLKSMLEPLGFTVILAEDGREAVKLVQQHKPDLLLTDLVMPEMTGFEVVQVLRQTPEFQKLPMVAVSASVFEMDKQRSKVVGCDDFLPKPINEPQLYHIIGTLLRLSWISPEGAEAEADMAAAESAEITVWPPRTELEALHELVVSGYLDDLQSRLKALEQQDAAYRPFVRRLLDMARAYQDVQIQALLEQALERADRM